MSKQWGYSEYNEYNRFTNLDGLEYKIVKHLINSDSKHADLFWKILKYDTIDALSKPEVSKAERLELLCLDEVKDKRLFMTPHDDDSQGDQCSSVYIYVEDIRPLNYSEAVVGVTVDTCVYTKIGIVSWDYDPDLNEQSNPNEDDNEESSIVVPYKSRETVLLKSILAELNGLYLDGIGYLSIGDFSKDENGNKNTEKSVTLPHQQRDKYHGHRIIFNLTISGVSSDSEIGY